MKKTKTLQVRVGEIEYKNIEDIRSILEFERQSGRLHTRDHPYSKDARITDSDVIRWIIGNFKFPEI